MDNLDVYYNRYLDVKILNNYFTTTTTSVKGVTILPLDPSYTSIHDGIAEEQQAILKEDAATALEASKKFESTSCLEFVASVFRNVGDELGLVLASREEDREWIDAAIAATAVPVEMGVQSGPLGQRMANKDYVPFGPLPGSNYRSGEGRQRVAPLPAHLQGPHVTLFGPADGVKMCANAMNCGQRRLPGEPAVVSRLVDSSNVVPMWGADDEDSRTPLRTGILAALGNVMQCIDGTLPSKLVEASKRSVPIKRIPGLGMPCHWLRVDGHYAPLHLVDLCMHVFHAWRLGERALTFYIPKLENEREARYLGHLLRTVEDLLPAPYKKGSIRVLIILENPRAVFRLNEIMDELYPYFAGASLGWHDYVAASARLFRNDPTYVMPAKADATIVVRHIREAHRLLADVCGARGGVAIGGMFGVLPLQGAASLTSDSMQVCLQGLIRDVLLQLRRGLNGFWIAHPDFCRIGLAIVHAFKAGEATLRELVHALVPDNKEQAEMLVNLASTSKNADADRGLDPRHLLYPRALLAAELGGAGATIVNHHEEEVRYNSVQAMQYITDWLMGNGCVALPTRFAHPTRKNTSVAVRVMDDLATTERSRWEVALELQHGRLDKVTAVRVAREEAIAIRSSNSGTAIAWHPIWSPIAYKIWLLLISTQAKFEFATELLLPFSVPAYRGPQAWELVVVNSAPGKYALPADWALVESLFDACHNESVVRHTLQIGKAPLEFLRRVFCGAGAAQAENDCPALLSRDNKIGGGGGGGGARAPSANCCSSSGGCDCGSSRNLMRVSPALAMAMRASNLLPDRFPSLECTQGSAVSVFQERLQSVLVAPALSKVASAVPEDKGVPYVVGMHRSFGAGGGFLFNEHGVHSAERLQIASLSKPVGTAFALEVFRKHRIPIDTSVTALLRALGSPFSLPPSPHNESVKLSQLFSHCSGIRQHYVHSFPGAVPPVETIMRGLTTDWGGVYAPLAVESAPESEFAYSGGGFLLGQHIVELICKAPVSQCMRPFIDALGMTETVIEDDYSTALRPGMNDDGTAVPRRAFPSFAAGMLSSCRDMVRFLTHLVKAFQPQNLNGSGPISHDTAVIMLGAPRRAVSSGAREFMACEVGTGAFISYAGANRITIHQGANEGFRCLFAACYDGPAVGATVVCMSAKDASSVPVLAAAARTSLVHLGVLPGDVLERQHAAAAAIALESGPQETRVNRTMKALLFEAFRKHYEPRIVRPADAPLQPFARLDVLRGAVVEYVSDDTFASAENMVHPSIPYFDPAAFFPDGKVMDSWESVRHNPIGYDECILRMARPATPRFAEVSTMWHDGNHSPFVEIYGKSSLHDKQWTCILSREALQPHSMHRFLVNPAGSFLYIRVLSIPDGGISRVRLYEAQPPGVAFPSQFRHDPQVIPAVVKAKRLFGVAEGVLQDAGAVGTQEALQMLQSAARQHHSLKALVNVICGAKVRSVSNQHYGPADAIISVCPPRGMFDGFETSRARAADLRSKFENVVVDLLVPMRLQRVDIDFTYFVNNNPNELSIEVETESNGWVVLFSRQSVKAWRKNILYVSVPWSMEAVKAIRVCSFPCGGFNRIRAQATVAELKNALISAAKL